MPGRADYTGTEGSLRARINLGGGGAFNPTSLITGAGGFWRADMGITLGGGGGGSTVATWTDQSSFGNNLSYQTTTGGTTSGGIFSSTSFNASFSGITWPSGDTVGLWTSASNIFPSTSTASIFALYEFSSSPTAFPNDRVVGCYSIPAASDLNTPGFLLATGAGTQVFHSNSTLGNGGSDVSASSSTPYLFGGVADGTHGNMWLNGTVQGAGVAFSSNLGDTTVRLFAGAAPNGGLTSVVTIAFWGVTQKAMNSTDWTNLKNWCNSNWGTSF